MGFGFKTPWPTVVHRDLMLADYCVWGFGGLMVVKHPTWGLDMIGSRWEGFGHDNLHKTLLFDVYVVLLMFYTTLG